MLPLNAKQSLLTEDESWIVAENGNIERIQAFHDDGHPWNETMFAAVVENGDINTIRWIYKKTVPGMNGRLKFQPEMGT